MWQKHIREMVTAIPWPILVMLALFLGFAPLQPQPHLFEKLSMLAEGELRSPLDIFDLLLHASPLLLVAAKLLLTRRAGHDT